MALAGWLCFSEVMATTVLADCPPQLIVTENGLDMRDFPQVTITLRLMDTTCAFITPDTIIITEEVGQPQSIKPILQTEKVSDLALTLDAADLDADHLEVGGNVLQQFLTFLEVEDNCTDGVFCPHNQAHLLLGEIKPMNKFTYDAEVINSQLNQLNLSTKYEGGWNDKIEEIVKDPLLPPDKYHAIIRVTSDSMSSTFAISGSNSTPVIYTLSVNNDKNVKDAAKLAEPIIANLKQQYSLSYKSNLLPDHQPHTITLTTVMGTQVITTVTLLFPVNNLLKFNQPTTMPIGVVIWCIAVLFFCCLELLFLLHYINLKKHSEV